MACSNACHSQESNFWCHKLVRSFDIRLKTVVFLTYKGTKSQVNFATFFIMNARMLEVMGFEG
ncbi:hypothetical protein U9M48_012376 [Paspalum notatum var. saurae]|uniref:FBD domain-containing protein n=1 Tax=Paspalum notatum var. saurae TaxID=547442 RepID=A0AAQ3SXC3_PASNO